MMLVADGEVQCDHCNRVVPIAPGRMTASVAHVYFVSAGISGDYRTPSYPDEYGPCPGNGHRRFVNDGLEPMKRLALQHAILDDDRYWEGL